MRKATAMIISRLRLENWRNFLRVEVPLARRMFLLGPNASGKSNLLDAFRFLRDLASPGGGLEKAVSDRGGLSRLRCLAARQYPDVVVEVSASVPADRPGPASWRYQIRIGQDKYKKPVVRAEHVWRGADQILTRPLPEDKRDPARLTQTFLEQVNANVNFRELAEFLRTVHYLHLVPQILRDTERSEKRNGDPFGRGFLERVALTSKKTRNSRLRKIERVLRVAVPQFKRINLERDARGLPHLMALYEHWRPQGAWQTEDQFSDGTLRLFGLLWSLLDGDGPLLLEEPELSLHAALVRRLAGLIHRMQGLSSRQVLVSSHSRDLVNDAGIGGEEVLLLIPSHEGTQVLPGKQDDQIRTLLEKGATVAEAALPRTEPQSAYQLELFR